MLARLDTTLLFPFNILILFSTALHCTALHCTALHCTALHCTALHCTALHCTALHCTALHCTALHCTALHCTALHCTALHCTALHCTAMRSFGKLYNYTFQLRLSTVKCLCLGVCEHETSIAGITAVSEGVIQCEQVQVDDVEQEQRILGTL